jgi:DNA-directed RNA polymerase specialized sigma24 family protein
VQPRPEAAVVAALLTESRTIRRALAQAKVPNHAAGDLEQDVVVHAWMAWKRSALDISTLDRFRALLRTIAWRAAWTWKNKYRNQVPAPGEATVVSGPPPHRRLEAADELRKIGALLTP